MMPAKKADMRLVFNDPLLKDKLQALAADLDISLNQLVNWILTGYFTQKEKKALELASDLLDMKK
jgi:hypothetical protein